MFKYTHRLEVIVFNIIYIFHIYMEFIYSIYKNIFQLTVDTDTQFDQEMYA